MAERAPATWQAYRAVLGARLRAQTSYRTSFAVELLGNLAAAAVELAEVYIIFHNITVLGGLDVHGALLIFAFSHLGFALADGAVGSLDEMPRLVRAGTLEVLLLRPLPLLAQLITGDVTLRRFGRALLALAILGFALVQAPIRWTPQRVALVVVTPAAGAAVFAALFVAAGAVQFWLVDAAEVTSAFTYGGSYAAMYPAAVLPLPLRVLFTFVVPAAFTGYLPTLALLGRPGPAGLPAWLGWVAPVVGAAAWAPVLAVWRLGVRHYTGAGG